MVVAKTLLKVLFILILLSLMSLIWFISQMAAPLISFILSFLSIVLTVLLPYVVKERTRRIIVLFIFSTIINANFLFYAVTGGSIIEIISYGCGLWAITWSLLFLLSETIASLSPKTTLESNSMTLSDQTD